MHLLPLLPRIGCLICIGNNLVEARGLTTHQLLCIQWCGPLGSCIFSRIAVMQWWLLIILFANFFRCLCSGALKCSLPHLNNLWFLRFDLCWLCLLFPQKLCKKSAARQPANMVQKSSLKHKAYIHQRMVAPQVCIPSCWPNFTKLCIPGWCCKLLKSTAYCVSIQPF